MHHCYARLADVAAPVSATFRVSLESRYTRAGTSQQGKVAVVGTLSEYSDRDKLDERPV